MEGSPSHGRGSPPAVDDPLRDSYLKRLPNLKNWFSKIRVDQVVPSLKAIFASSAPSQVPDELSLFRAQIYQGVVNGPALTREQELALQKQLDHVLDQVQTCVKALDRNPIYESDLLNVYGKSGWPYQGSRDHKHHSSISHRSIIRPSMLPVTTSEANQKKLLNIIDNFSSSTKALVAARLAKHELSAEFAQLMYLRIELLNRNVQLAVESSGRCFSFTGLLGRLTKPGLTSLFDNLSFFGFKLQEIATITECVVDNIGTSPGHFSTIGRETDTILSEDFCFKKMKLNSDPFENISFALGAEDGDGLSVHQFLMKLKKDNSSVFLSAKSVVAPPYGNVAGNAIPNGFTVANPNAALVQGVAVVNDNAPADIALIKLALDEVYGRDFKCIIQCPYPSLHAKLEVKATDPYMTYGGYVGLHRNSKMNVSFLLGVKSGGVGMQYTHDYKNNAGSFGCGFRFRSSLATYGFTFNEPGTYKATVCQKIIDSATTVAAVASYSQIHDEEHGAKLAFGVKHSFDPSLFLKARAGSEGISVAMKKSFCSGKFTVKAASHVDVRDPWRSPKVGVVFSCRR